MKNKKSFFNLDVTLEQAVEAFSKKDPAIISSDAGVGYNKNDNELIVPFINKSYKISSPNGQIKDMEGNSVSSYLSIIILHYLTTADGTSLTGRWISYRHLPGGDIYINPFTNRAIKPFLKQFGEQPDSFVRAAKMLGGKKAETSGINMVITVLPRVPICFTIWPGDDEFPASANILFDEKASSYLPTEDYAHIPSLVTSEMKKTMEN